MLRHPDYTRDRIKQLVNRLGRKIYADAVDVTDLVVAGPIEERISHDEAQKLSDFRPAAVGDQFRPTWSTFWFRGSAQVPTAWKGQRVDLLWDSQSEATLWVDGRSVQGLNMTQGDRPEAILLDKCNGGETLKFQIEMACNRKFGAADGEGRSGGKQAISPFHLRRCAVARFNAAAHTLYFDALVLTQLMLATQKEDHTNEKTWSGTLLAELNRFCNTIDEDDESTWPAARAILTALYEHHNASDAFELSAIGHAHIDTAWLWPLAETWRKCERTFSTQSKLMGEYPEYRFSCSQAYQYDIIRQRNPDLYARIKQRVAGGQWVPVGGTWIEPDCNIPSGEALCRQFLFGQTYFEQQFGLRCKEFWNPDVFGYNGQLPQIMRLAGVRRFLTQKLSWNRFNKPHHHTFTWRGIDGSEVLTHFPPADTYNAMGPDGPTGEIDWLRRNARDFRDHDRSNEGMMLFGFGDGGGGPTRTMLEIIRRAEDLQGLPRTKQRTSDEFFDRLEKDCDDLPVMWGELYFEYHRGTYTSQAMVKKNNRRGEQVLHDLELIAAIAAASGKSKYPREAINELWKVLLLNQFHDILPGSSITPVYADSAAQFKSLFEMADGLLGQRLGQGDTPVNTAPYPRAQVVDHNGALLFVKCPALGPGAAADAPDSVKLTESKAGFVLENALIRATVARTGRVTSLVHKASGREALAGDANVFELYDDRPTNYDAWDVDPYHLETRKELPGADKCSVARQDPLRAELRFEHTLGKGSTMVQTIRLDAASPVLSFHTTVEWNESNVMLKVAFPVVAHAMNATYEMQFGHVQRPTHYNTPYDLARYEVPMHRWFDLSETGFGVAILNDCKYGGSTFGHTMRLSLLRAPKVPDPTCDIGSHAFAYALMPHAGTWQEAGVVAEAARFNHPIRFAAEAAVAAAPVACTDNHFHLDTVKLAEQSDGLVVRGYEAHGARGSATLQFTRPFKKASLVNVLEEKLADATFDAAKRTVTVDYRPHQIVTVMVE